MNAVLLAVVYAWALGSCAWAQSQTHTTVRHHREVIEEQPAEIAQAETAIQNNDFAGAETLLKKAIEKEPRNYLAWFDLGFVLNRLGRMDESTHAYRQSVAAKPDVFESNLNLGLTLARANSPEAERFLSAATKLKPTDHANEGLARAWLALAHVEESANPEEAVAAYSKAAELTPKDVEPHLSAGLLHERRKEFAAAEDEYRKALAIDPNCTEATIGLTNLSMASGKVHDAEPLLRQLALQRPGDAGVHLQLGRVLLAKGKMEDAIAEFEWALKISPKDADAQRELADAYTSAGKNDLAEVAYRTLVTAQPNDAELHRGLGHALLLQKKFPEAEEEFLRALRLKRDWPDIYVDVAFAASENKNYDLTVRALNGRAGFSAEMPVICFFVRATAYDHLKDYKLAAVDYHHFLEVANGKFPDQEWQATHRLIAIEPKKR